ncbi:MAG: hypothetical protein JW931_05440 [Methanomicrobiaceae archaeon]|nr:hypothetical protein [Methanomicrobiaceae archaeon]
MKKYIFTILLLVLSIQCVTAVNVILENGTVLAGETTTLILSMNEAPLGFAGYSVNVSVDSEYIQISDVEFPDWALMTDAIGLEEGAEVRLKAVDLGHAVEAGATDIELARITFSGIENGSSLIQFSNEIFSDDSDNDINPVFPEPVIVVCSSGNESGLINVILEEGSVSVGETTTLLLSMDKAPLGFAGYFVNVSVDLEYVRITDVEYPDWALMTDTIGLEEGAEVRLKTVDLGHAVESGATDIELARITFTGIKNGSSQVQFSNEIFSDDSDNDINPVFPEPVIVVCSLGNTSAVVSTTSAEVATPDNTAEITLTLNQVPDGFSGYNVYLNIGNASVAEVTSVSYPPWALMNDVSSLPATENVLLKAADLSNEVQAGATDIELATITVRGLYPGTTGFVFTSPNFDDESGSNMDVSFISGSFTVTRFAPLAITGIDPAEESNKGPVNITIRGSGFLQGATVILRNANFTNISGYDLSYTSGSEIISGFNLTKAETGNWSVIVTNINGESVTDENGFWISSSIIPIEGQEDTPNDLNGDGLYEDLNGNSQLDYADVNMFFEKLDWIIANGAVWGFDFNSDGTLEFIDIIALYEMI